MRVPVVRQGGSWVFAVPCSVGEGIIHAAQDVQEGKQFRPLPQYHIMKSHFFRDLVDRLSGVACDSCDELKTAAKERIVEPLRDAGGRVSSAARDKAEDAAAYTRRTAERSEEWISEHQAATGAIILGVGLILGCFLHSKLRR